MKKLMCLAALGGMLVMASDASAGQRLFRLTSNPNPFTAFYDETPPAPAPVSEGAPVEVAPVPDAGPAPAAPALYHCVRYEDRDNIAPCAVTRIVEVKDPCACSHPCSCCAPRCVLVEICVPPCACERVKTSRCGTKVTYDYGKYEVEITSRDGVIKVDYDD